MRRGREALLNVAKLGAQYNLAMHGDVRTVLLTLDDSGGSATASLNGETLDDVEQAAKSVAMDKCAKAAAVVVAGRAVKGESGTVFIYLHERGRPPEVLASAISENGRGLGAWRRASVEPMTLVVP